MPTKKALNNQEITLLERAFNNKGVTTCGVATGTFKIGVRLVRKRLMTQNRSAVLILERGFLLSRSPWHYDFRLTKKGREIAKGL